MHTVAAASSRHRPRPGRAGRRPAIALVVGLLAGIAHPDAETRWMDIERSTITARFVAADGSPAAADHVLELRLAEGSVEDTDTPHLALVIDVSDLRVVAPRRPDPERRELRDRVLAPDGLDAARFTRITYHSLTIDRVDPGLWLVHGELEMRGRFRPLTVRAVRDGDRFTGTTTVRPVEFGIPRARSDGGPGGGEVRVAFDIRLEGAP